MRRAILAFGLLAAVLPAPAFAEDNLRCVISGYSDEQQEIVSAYRAAYDIEALRDPSGSTEVMAVNGQRAAQCAGEHGWNQEATTAARQYGWRYLSADFILHAMPLEPAQKLDLLSRYDAADREQLIDAISAASGNPILGRERRAPTDEDFAVVDSVVRLSEHTDGFTYGVWLGAWLTMSLLRDDTADRFAAL